MKKYFLILLTAPLILFFSCKKGPGEGGETTIQGKVWAEEWDDLTYTQHYDSLDRWAMDEEVYLIYGDDASYSERTRSGPDGVFEFKYLREGDYTVYLYSGAPNNSTTPGGKEAISKRIGIPDEGTFDAGTFVIKK